MSKSDYTYRFFNYEGKKFILIEDLDEGGMSVTNNIENVVQEICSKEQVKAKDYLFVYKDSQGQWDAWDNEVGDFVVLFKQDYLSAVQEYISIIEAKKQT